MAQYQLLDLGLLPGTVRLGAMNGLALPPDTNERFRLELWQSDGFLELRQQQQKLQLPQLSDQIIGVPFLRPAKGKGYSEITLIKSTPPHLTVNGGSLIVKGNRLNTFEQSPEGPSFTVSQLEVEKFHHAMTLLSGRYDDLEWMRSIAERLAQTLQLTYQEIDGGDDY